MNILLDEEDNVSYGKEIYSMAIRYKHQTGLPVNVWIDERGAYENSGHWKRMKFQINHGNKMRNQPDASMDLNGEVVWDTYDKTVSEISTKDIKEVRYEKV